MARVDNELARADVGRGYYLYGVMRARGRRTRKSTGGSSRHCRIRFRDLDAIVRPSPFDLPELDQRGLEAHQRIVGELACQGTILPAPPGVVFAGRRPLVGFLDDQYVTLVEGLALLEGHWEFRLHVAQAEGTERTEVGGWPRLFGELRGRARAALSFPHADGKGITAAFLVERPRWIDFIEKAESLGAARPELSLDLTGPWPPYDFVKLIA